MRWEAAQEGSQLVRIMFTWLSFDQTLGLKCLTRMKTAQLTYLLSGSQLISTGVISVELDMQ